MCLALRKDASDDHLDATVELLAAQRPTAINLRWALREMRDAVRNIPRADRVEVAYGAAASPGVLSRAVSNT